MKIEQLSHNQIFNKVSNKDIVVVTQNIRTPENIGMLFRVCEAFAVKSVFLTGNSPDLTNKKVIRTARKTERQLIINKVEINQVLKKLKTANYNIIGLEKTTNSIAIQKVDFTNTNKIAIILGAERFGIDKNTLLQVDQTIHINMFGKNSSLNVVNALGICLFEITKTN